jgi:amino acid transporter
MKTLIIILCGLAMLFAGGCLIAIGSEGPMAGGILFWLFAILCFNAFFIWAAVSAERWSGPALIACGLVDLGVAGFAAAQYDERYVGPIAAALAIVFAIKALAGFWLGYSRIKAGKGAADGGP